jgi:hypothetical protein
MTSEVVPRWLTVVVWAGLVAGAAGCASGQQVSGPDAGSDAGAADVSAAGVSCLSPGFIMIRPSTSAAPSPEPSPQSLPGDFTPVSASRCLYKVVPVPGDGEWQVRVEQTATSQLDVLMRALRQPSKTGGANVACPAIGRLPLVLTLTDGHGRSLVPAIPHEVCGGPSRTVVQTIQALPWNTIRQTMLNRIRSQLELDSACQPAYKPMIAIEASTGTHRSPAAGAFFPGTPPTALEVCRYALDETSTIGLAGSGTLKMGKLSTTAKLSGGALDRLVAALNAAPPVTAACTKPQAPFAVLNGDGRAGLGSIELGGCDRALDNGNVLHQLDAATVAILAG